VIMMEIENTREVKIGLYRRMLKSEMFHNYKNNLPAIIGSIIFLLTVLIALIGPYLVNQNPYDLAEI